MDPDLEMMRDEQRKQERVLKREVEDAKEKRKAMEREKDEWQLMAESLKAEIERLKADIQKQKEDVSTIPLPLSRKRKNLLVKPRRSLKQ